MNETMTVVNQPFTGGKIFPAGDWLGKKMSDLAAPKRPDFFKVYLPDFSSKRLTIPTKFVQFMEGRTSGSVNLMGPSRNVWQVEMCQKEDWFYFEEGWPAFVKDHNMKIGELFHFHYEGSMCFTVVIYDYTACEKESAFSATCSLSKQEEKKKSNLEASTSSGLVMKAIGENKVLCLERDEQRAKPLTSRHPFFLVKMKAYHVGNSNILHVPAKFLKEHNLIYHSNEKIVLQNQNGESQEVNIIVTRNSTTFCAGWRSFVRSSDIKEGNTCVFTLVENFKMHVNIVPPEKLKFYKQ